MTKGSKLLSNGKNEEKIFKIHHLYPDEQKLTNNFLTFSVSKAKMYVKPEPTNRINLRIIFCLCGYLEI